jgi:DNA-binding NarL/FixJ family response regulator
MSQPTRVAIVEDNAKLREQLAALITGADGFTCAATFPDGLAALKGMAAAAPDVVLMDIQLPRMTGVDCVARLREIMPAVKVVMLTAYDDSDLIFRALENGASGYLLKRTPPDELLRAIADVQNGGAPMSSHIARLVVQTFHRRGPSPRAADNLTPREEEVLRYVSQGLINKEIADKLNVSTETIRQHLKNCYAKLHVRSRTEAAMKLRGGG